MTRSYLSIAYLLLLSFYSFSFPFDSLLFYGQTSQFALGAELEGGIGKTRDRTLWQPWNFSGSAQLGLELRLFSDYALLFRSGYTYFNDDPAVFNMIREEAFKAELTVHELSTSLSQIMRPLGFLWFEQGLILVFPCRTDYDIYISYLSGNGWTDYQPYSTEKLDRSFYYSFPLFNFAYAIGLDISGFWRYRIPVSLFFRQELGLTNMYVSSDLFAATGREQNRLCWGVRTMLFNGGKSAPNVTLSSTERKYHSLELSLGLGGGFGNLRSVKDDSRFHQEEMAHASIGLSYVLNSRFRLSADFGDQLRQYTESEFNYKSYVPPPYDDFFRKDYFHHYINYLGTRFWLDAFPYPYVVSGMGIGLYWMLPFGNYAFEYIESESTGVMVKERVYDPHETYSYSFDPALLFKLGSPLYRFTNVPLELDLIFQWGWRTPKIRIGFYRETRPTYAAISLGITYIFRLLN